MILPPFLIYFSPSVFSLFKEGNLSLDPTLFPDNIIPNSTVDLEWVVGVVAHEAARAFDTGTEDGSEFPFNLLCGHGIPQG
jgi:hypothetical protein